MPRVTGLRAGSAMLKPRSSARREQSAMIESLPTQGALNLAALY
jgi:hypothetical protein